MLFKFRGYLMGIIPTIDNPRGMDGFYLVAYHVEKHNANRVALIENWAGVLDFKHQLKFSHDYLLGVWKCEEVNYGETQR